MLLATEFHVFPSYIIIQTTLEIFEWLKVEDIHASLFLVGG